MVIVTDPPSVLGEFQKNFNTDNRYNVDGSYSIICGTHVKHNIGVSSDFYCLLSTTLLGS